MHHATSLFQVNMGIQDSWPNPYLKQKQVMRINRLHFTSASVVSYILFPSRLLKLICLAFAMHNSIKIRFFFKSRLWHSRVLLLFSEQFQNQCIPFHKKTWQASVKCYSLLWHRMRDGWGMKSEVPDVCKLQLQERWDVLPMVGREVIASRSRGRGRGLPRGGPQHTFMLWVRIKA